MYNQFIKIIADNTESFSADMVKPEMRFYEDLDMNSMDIINMTIDIESAFSIKLKEKDFKNIHTVADLKSYVEKIMKKELA